MSTSSDVKEISSSKCFGGHQKTFEHTSKQLGCKMKFSIFFPSTSNDQKLPVLYFLSGLTCTEQNMFTKTSIQQYAEEYKIIVIAPDTSPRGCNVPGEEDDWDIGTGAGFYVDATQAPWNKNYRMYSYVTRELREVIDRQFPCVDGNRVAISGHSMGGHGALVCFFRNPQIYRAVSAFAPISNPTQSAWGRKCFAAYLGTEERVWKEYDATELVKLQPQRGVNILIDQGKNDEWMSYLSPMNFINACQAVGQKYTFKEREGYDHGYFYVRTFIGEHMKFFAEALYH